MRMIRAVAFTILALLLAVVVVGGLGELGLGGFLVLVSLAVIGFALWWRRSRPNA